MNWADWTIFGILALSCVISLIRGFVKEALSLAIWAGAFAIAVMFRAPLAELLTDVITAASLREMAAFAILFISTLIVGSLVSYILGKFIKATGLTGTDRLLGAVFGLGRGVIVVISILILVPPIVPINEDPWWQESTLIPHFLLLEDWSRKTATDIGGVADEILTSQS